VFVVALSVPAQNDWTSRPICFLPIRRLARLPICGSTQKTTTTTRQTPKKPPHQWPRTSVTCPVFDHPNRPKSDNQSAIKTMKKRHQKHQNIKRRGIKKTINHNPNNTTILHHHTTTPYNNTNTTI
jgi:hypothetical protein